jgi:hypothetical protein
MPGPSRRRDEGAVARSRRRTPPRRRAVSNSGGALVRRRARARWPSRHGCPTRERLRPQRHVAITQAAPARSRPAPRGQPPRAVDTLKRPRARPAPTAAVSPTPSTLGPRTGHAPTRARTTAARASPASPTSPAPCRSPPGCTADAAPPHAVPPARSRRIRCIDTVDRPPPPSSARRRRSAGRAAAGRASPWPWSPTRSPGWPARTACTQGTDAGRAASTVGGRSSQALTSSTLWTICEGRLVDFFNGGPTGSTTPMVCHHRRRHLFRRAPCPAPMRSCGRSTPGSRAAAGHRR